MADLRKSILGQNNYTKYMKQLEQSNNYQIGFYSSPDGLVFYPNRCCHISDDGDAEKIQTEVEKEGPIIIDNYIDIRLPTRAKPIIYCPADDIISPLLLFKVDPILVKMEMKEASAFGAQEASNAKPPGGST